jgi:hypothetical protein
LKRYEVQNIAGGKINIAILKMAECNIYAAILKSKTEWRRAAFKLKQVAAILNLVSGN